MSLVSDFKDRVPTEVLANGAIRYEIFDSNGTSQGYMWIKRADAPSEVGNKWNKLIYDGIKEAIESLDSAKLAITSKATQAQAEGGSDNTKYMTALRVLQEINALALPSKQMSIKTGTISNNGTIPQTSGYSNHMYFVSLNEVHNSRTQDTFPSSYDTSSYTFAYKPVCEVNQSTRKVTVGAYGALYHGTLGSTDWRYWVAGTANYIELAWN